MNRFLILLGLYVAVGTAISVIVFRARQTEEEYFVGGRMISGFVSSLTYASTTYSAFMMVGLVGLSFQTGIGALVFEVSYLAGTILLLSLYGKKIWKMGKQKGFVSPIELLTYRYGRSAGVFASGIAIVALIPYTSSQVIALGLIFQSFGGFRFIYGVSFAAVVIILWTFIGGLRGVAITDAIQGMFMVCAAFAGIVWTGSHYGGLELLRFPSDFWTPVRFVNFTLPWFFFALTNPQVVQRLFIPRNERSFNRMVFFFGLYGFIYTLIVTGIGFSARHGAVNGLFPVVQDRDRVIIEVLARMRPWLAISLALSIVFASVSTANSIILTLTSMVARDIFRRRKKIVVGKSFILILTGIVFLFSIFRPNYIVELAVSSSSILLCTLPLIFGVFHWKRGGPVTAVSTLFAGAATAVATRAFGVPLSSVYTFFVSFAMFFGVSMLEKSPRGRI